MDKGHGRRKQEQERQGKLNFKVTIARWKKVVTALVGRDRLGCLGPCTRCQSPERAPILPRETEAEKGELGLWPSADVMWGQANTQTPTVRPISEQAHQTPPGPTRHPPPTNRPHQAPPDTPMAPPGPPPTGPTRTPRSLPQALQALPALGSPLFHCRVQCSSLGISGGRIWGYPLATAGSGARQDVLTLGSLRTPGSVY